jgi:hypothetical protein
VTWAVFDTAEGVLVGYATPANLRRLPSPTYLCIAMPTSIPVRTSAAYIINRVGKFVFMFLFMLYPNVFQPHQAMKNPLFEGKGNSSVI